MLDDLKNNFVSQFDLFIKLTFLFFYSFVIECEVGKIFVSNYLFQYINHLSFIGYPLPYIFISKFRHFFKNKFNRFFYFLFMLNSLWEYFEITINENLLMFTIVTKVESYSILKVTKNRIYNTLVWKLTISSQKLLISIIKHD